MSSAPRPARRSLVALTLAALALAVGASPLPAARAAGQPAKALHALTVWLDWYPNSDHVGIYVAMAKGYYARAGLAVHAQVPPGAADALPLVAHGNGDIAISYEPEVLLARARGVPVVATASIVQQPLNCIMTLRSSRITRPRQLQGRTVAVAGAASDNTTITALVKKDGGDPTRVKTVLVDYSLLQALLSRRADAIEGAYWTWEALQARAQGQQVNIMHVERYGVPTYDELVLATGSRQMISEPDVLRAFQQATLRGYAYAAAHPAEAARLLTTVPGVLSRSRALIQTSITTLAPLFHDAHGRYGTLDETRWQVYADWMTRTGLMHVHLDAHTALSTNLLP